MNKKLLANFRNILSAEDDSDFFYFFKAALLSFSTDLNVLRTTNGIMLLSLIETSIKPDIIFLDINMPYKNGIQCLEEIKKKGALTSTKVVICSVSDDSADINNCYSKGADFYFVKPSITSVLHDKFKNLFHKCLTYQNVRPPRGEFILN